MIQKPKQSNRRNRNRAAERGMTLIEIMVVIIIIMVKNTKIFLPEFRSATASSLAWVVARSVVAVVEAVPMKAVRLMTIRKGKMARIMERIKEPMAMAPKPARRAAVMPAPASV